MTVRNFIKQAIRRVTGTQIIIHQLDALKGDIDAAAERLAAAPPTAAAPEAPATPAPTDVRQKVAYEYLKPGSSGIEIGAFASPLAVPPGVHVAYLDRHDPREIQAEFNIAGLTPKDFGFDSAALIVPDILDDGQALAKVGDLSQDFVIANHVLEHFENPVKGFKNMLRVLKHGGVLYLALPEMQHSFDRIRRPTPFEHVWRDYEEGPAWSRRQAFEEFAEVFVENGMDKNLFPQSSGDARAEFTRRVADDLEREDFSIHFHAWRMPDMLEMFLQLHRRLHIGFRLELAQANGDEVIFIFRRTEFTIR